MSAVTNEPFLSPDEIAQRVGLSRRAVYDAIRRGELRAMRLCGRLRIRGEDFDAWLATSATRPRPLPPHATSHHPPRPATPAGSFKDLMAEGGGERRVA